MVVRDVGDHSITTDTLCLNCGIFEGGSVWKDRDVRTAGWVCSESSGAEDVGR